MTSTAVCDTYPQTDSDPMWIEAPVQQRRSRGVGRAQAIAREERAPSTVAAVGVLSRSGAPQSTTISTGSVASRFCGVVVAATQSSSSLQAAMCVHLALSVAPLACGACVCRRSIAIMVGAICRYRGASGGETSFVKYFAQSQIGNEGYQI